MVIALDSAAVDALVYFISEQEGKPVYFSGSASTSEITKNDNNPVVAIQYKRKSQTDDLKSLNQTDTKEIVKPEKTKDSSAAETKQNEIVLKTAKAVSAKESLEMKAPIAEPEDLSVTKITKKEKVPNKKSDLNASKPEQPGVKDFLKAIQEKQWIYATRLDRYIVQFDKNTYIVLTIRPKLQKKLESIFKKYSTRIGASVMQDPRTGEILAMTSCHKNKTLDIESKDFHKNHWALKATFPIASIFKIITASAGIDSGTITANSRFRAWKKSYMKVWRAFARSHNGVFGRIARKTTRSVLAKYSEAYGFNKPFIFDLPVSKSIAKLPTNKIKMGQAAAGLNRNFVISPMHVASIVSTVLNRGKTLKPFLIDYVVRKNKIIFRRKPFQVAQPIKESTARDLYKMMFTTTAIGTGKKGFGGYRRCPNLSKMCGGKTGTLTGASPHYLFTWFGGFMKVTGRDLCIVTLVGQRNHSQTKASSIAGQIAYELYMERQENQKNQVASN
jgi:membrane peptidoglycan carboxypeptidase